MNRPPFFPNTEFAWAFCGVLILLTCVAAWIDTRTAKIPNRLTVLTLVLGLIANAVRGGWLAANDMQVWWLWKYDPGAVWLGVIDGLLFAVTGFLIAFAAMFVFWIFKGCGGGDVKLFGALGGWIGFAMFPIVWAASVFVLIVWAMMSVLSGGVSPKQIQKRMKTLKQPTKGAAPGQVAAKPGKFRVTYSLPIAVATTLVLFWWFRFELQLAVPKPPAQQAQEACDHDRPSPLA